jgi:osmotically-inducible protein OsmY
MRSIFSLSALVLALGALPAIGEEDSTRALSNASRRADEAVEDAWITGHIKLQFLADSFTQGWDMNVTTQDRDVTLEGTVPSESIRERALSIAQDTDGVAKVHDKLDVDPLAMKLPTSGL